MTGVRRVLYSLYCGAERVCERVLELALAAEPGWSRRHPYRRWFPVVVMLCFVFVDNFRPADPRAIMRLTPLEADLDFGLRSLFFSLTKVQHISYFFLLYLFLRRLLNERRIMVFVLALTFLIEFQQAFTSGREARPLDLLPNLVGVWLGRRYLQDRERRGPRQASMRDSACRMAEG